MRPADTSAASRRFGGHILSHDFVEAALIRRAGYSVYMLPSLGGSYEESPPSLIDVAARDRRWCQGNLQHIRILPAKGLVWPTRQHFATGIMGYVASPLWLAQLLVGILLVLQADSQKKCSSLKTVGFECRRDQDVGINHEAQCKHQRFFFSDLAVLMT